jgi:ABC-2 type transport system permease protein
MRSFFVYLGIQLKADIRDRGILMTYYLVPLVFFVVIGSVFSSINPLMKPGLAASMSIFAVTMGAVMGTPLPLVRARESGTLRAFRINGIPDGAVLAVHTVSACIHLFIVSVIIYVLSPVLLHSDWPSHPGLYMLVLLLILLASVGIGILIGSTVRSQSTASMISMLVFLPTVMLGGIMFPATLLPPVFEKAALVLPATYAMQAFGSLAFEQHTSLHPALCLCMLAGFCAVSFILALWRFAAVIKKQ